MRILRFIAGILFLITGLLLVLFSIMAFTDKEMGGGVGGIIFIILAGLFTLLGTKLTGIKLNKKAKIKTENKKPKATEKPEAGTKKKTFREWLFEVNKNLEEQKRKAKELKERQYQEFEDSIGNHVFISYEDARGNSTDRTIEIKNVYEKYGQLYVFAYCFMKDANRTFLADRIFSMKNKYNGKNIRNIEGFLRRKFLNAPSKTDMSAEDLAAQALE